MRRPATLVTVALAVFLCTSDVRAQNCSNTTVGFTPLNDLGAGLYQGFAGGLYPGGQNVRPAGHEAAGLVQAASVVPRDAAGLPDAVNGKIVFLSIGMSNTRNHFNAFIPLADADPLRDPNVVVLNTAQGGQPAEDMDQASDPYWGFVDQRLADAGVTAQQVQALWLLQANRSPTDPFPQHAQNLQSQFAAILQIVRDRFPNARQCFVASRIYAGYATTTLNPEPWSYEQGFANKWLIEQQLAGDPTLNFEPARGPVEAPWIAWGPYMWADGLVPRADGLTWECSDFNPDGTHPGPTGAGKVAAALLEFMHSDSVTSWYRGEGEPGLGVRFCSPAVPNSSGVGGRMAVTGSSVVADDNLVLSATQLPTNSNIGYFLMGTGANTFTPPGSVGPICIAPGLRRYLPPVSNTSEGPGGFARSVGTSGPVSGQIAPGSTWSFQAWHRDSSADTSNLTDAIGVTFR